MTRINSIGAAAAAFAAVVVAAPDPAASAPPNIFIVKNNSNALLACSTKHQGTGWTARFQLKPGQQWSLTRDVPTVYFFCDPPVPHQVYQVERGARYSFLVLGEKGVPRLTRVDVAAK